MLGLFSFLNNKSIINTSIIIVKSLINKDGCAALKKPQFQRSEFQKRVSVKMTSLDNYLWK